MIVSICQMMSLYRYSYYIYCIILFDMVIRFFKSGLNELKKQDKMDIKFFMLISSLTSLINHHILLLSYLSILIVNSTSSISISILLIICLISLHSILCLWILLADSVLLHSSYVHLMSISHCFSSVTCVCLLILSSASSILLLPSLISYVSNVLLTPVHGSFNNKIAIFWISLFTIHFLNYQYLHIKYLSHLHNIFELVWKIK